jgi:hypothetical protein
MQAEPLETKSSSTLFKISRFTATVLVVAHVSIVGLAYVFDGGRLSRLSLDTYLSLLLGQLDVLCIFSLVFGPTVFAVKAQQSEVLMLVLFIVSYVPVGTIILYVRAIGGLGGLPLWEPPQFDR